MKGTAPRGCIGYHVSFDVAKQVITKFLPSAGKSSSSERSVEYQKIENEIIEMAHVVNKDKKHENELKKSIEEKNNDALRLASEVQHAITKSDETQRVANGEYSSEGAAREWNTVVDISIPPPSYKPVSLSLSRSFLSKIPKQVFFNPINISNTFTHSITVF